MKFEQFLEEQKSKQEVIVVINSKNKFDADGKSTNKENHTLVDVYLDGKLSDTKLIGGVQYRKPELVGKAFKGTIDGAGFVRLPLSNKDAAELLKSAVKVPA